MYLCHRGDSLILQKGCITATSWQDNKIFTVMSTNCQPNQGETVLRRQRNGSRVALPCPTAVVLYNAYMGGVDRGDQLRGYYSCRSRSHKFYKYVFYFLVDTAITNAYILHTKFVPSHAYKHVKDFRVDLAEGLDR